MTSISFFELGVEDADKGRAFYGAMFGWEFETGPAMQGFGIKTGGVPGGMHPNDKGVWPYVFFQVEDLDAALERVQELGGEVQEGFDDDKPENVAKFGRFKFCKDDQGSPFGLHEPPKP
ncbi:VOC family protein [Solirubrobacter phytolaccae]|uniref:VOC family protein n=1 Tax=Solirubrobacter phytolaccae TaxID=1404360 RepID=A0A9X3S5Z1_9ACTN|nr:VOC family protein [Solirubrobacter phytolaccae]MDA0179464.1 VOC family protein [Solirubrobacter phytolaccae]